MAEFLEDIIFKLLFFSSNSQCLDDTRDTAPFVIIIFNNYSIVYFFLKSHLQGFFLVDTKKERHSKLL
jgi:hypothetical protein